MHVVCHCSVSMATDGAEMWSTSAYIRPRSEYSDADLIGIYVVLSYLGRAISSEYDSYPAWGVRANVDHDEKNHRT